MIYLIIASTVIFIIIIISIINKVKNSHIKEIDYKVVLSYEEIEKELENKLDIISRLMNILERSLKKDNKIFKKVKNIASDKPNQYEKDSLLIEASNEILDIKENNENYIKAKSFNGLIKELEDSNLKLIALRTYYNKYAAMYNNLITKFSNKLLVKIKHYHTKNFFEGKELEEESL